VLRFRLGPFPVTVYPSFFIAALLLGFWGGAPWRIAAWIFVVFVSVLVHELGHALFGLWLGGRPEIKLEGFGGETYPRLPSRPSALKQFGLSLAGPVAGLLLGAAAFALGRVLPPDAGSPSAFVLRQFKWVSVVWAGFNLLPMLPLDGGHMLLAAVEGVRKKSSLALVSWLSVGVAVAVAAAAFLIETPFDPIFIAIWCALFGFQNLSRARLAGRQPQAGVGAAAEPIDPISRADIARATELAREALGANDPETALRAAAALEGGDGLFRQAAGLRLRAGIELARGDNDAAAVFAGQSFSLFATPDAAVVAARANLRLGQRERAQNWLRRAVEAGAPPAAVRADPELAVIPF
jgi:Zn-dependent protease